MAQSNADEQGRVMLSKHYERATNKSGYYFPNTEAKLVSDQLRQIWRNHIPGASMVQHGHLSHFASLTPYPEANPHFREATEKYRNLLTAKGTSTFLTFTFEELFETLSRHFQKAQQLAWIEHLYHRYLFGATEPETTPEAAEKQKKAKSPNRGV